MSITLENTKLNVRLAKRRLFDGIRRQSRKLRGIENPQKVFCIGRGKTGSTSMYRALWDFGYLMGDELEAATLYDAYYYKDEFGPLIEYCKRYEAFQDLPFSAPNTFKVLDAAFPDRNSYSRCATRRNNGIRPCCASTANGTRGAKCQHTRICKGPVIFARGIPRTSSGCSAQPNRSHSTKS